MSDALDRLGIALLDASLAAVAITGLVVLAMVQCRQPARQLVWARAGLISSLALLPLSALNPVQRIDVRQPFRSLLPSGVEEPPRRAPAAVNGNNSPAFGGAIGNGPVPETRHDPVHGPPWLRQVSRGVVLAYLAGISLGLGAIAFGLWGLAWLVRRSWPPSEESLAILASLPFEGPIARPRLLVSDRVTRPVLVDAFRPIILVPPELEGSASAERLRLSLLHELAHAEGADHRVGLAGSLSGAIWFFLPTVWWIRGQMRLDQEFLADRRAVEDFGTTGGYASSLVELAASLPSDFEEASTPSTDSPETIGPGAASALFQRVLMLVKCPFAIEGQAPIWWRWSTAVTIGLITLATSCLTLRGLAGWSSSTTSAIASAEVGRSIRLPQLVISAREHDDQPFDLRFRLPEKFSLTFEVLAEPADLPTLEVLGHPLGPPADLDLDPDREVYRLWHRVEIRRVGTRENVEVDDRPVIAEGKPAKLASWLTIRPLRGQATRLRELELSW